MAGRNKQSLGNDLIEMTARLPWWAGVGLALLSYVIFHALASRPVPAMSQPGQLGVAVSSAMVSAVAWPAQFLAPFLFLMGAFVSFIKRRKAEQLHAFAGNRADGVARMTWREFEALVGEYFRRQGYTVTGNSSAGPDGGVDVLLQKGSDRYLVQCKHWRALRVGVQPVRELYGVMAAGRVAGGFVVTSGEFTDEARRFAEGRELKLIDGKMLERGIRAQAAALSVPVTRTAANPQLVTAPVAAPRQPEPVRALAPASSVMPACPLCNAAMVMRQARSGATPGKPFWGCSRYGQTQCRGTREIFAIE